MSNPTPEQAKANADAALAVGALCGALGAVGREVIATKIQHRFEEVIAAHRRLPMAPDTAPNDDQDRITATAAPLLLSEAVRYGISDPSRYTKRRDGESLTDWQARAVLHSIVRHGYIVRAAPDGT